MTTKYTPGPWVIDKEYTDTGGLVTVIRNAAYHYVVSEYGVSEDDAPIIAAAPELVEALRMVLDEGHSYESEGMARDYARALLARIDE